MFPDVSNSFIIIYIFIIIISRLHHLTSVKPRLTHRSSAPKQCLVIAASELHAEVTGLRCPFITWTQPNNRYDQTIYHLRKSNKVRVVK